jgi:hypothetical protein
MSKTLGNPPRNIDPALYKWLDRVRTTLEKGERVRPNQSVLDAYVKWRDLTDAGVVRLQGGISGGGHGFVPVGSGNDAPNMSVPPAPTGLEAAGSFSSVILSWDDPQEMYSNHGITEIHRAEVDDLGQAIVVGRSESFIWADMNTTQGRTYYYWIRFISDTGVEGPFNGASGTLGHVRHNPDSVHDILTSKRWTVNTLYYDGQVVAPSRPFKIGGVEVHFQAQRTGFSHTSEPSWHNVSGFGGEVKDGTMTWVAVEAGRAPFITGFVDGKPMVFMHGAAIKEATIESAAIKTLAADKLFALSATVLEAIINQATIHRLSVGRDIRSSSYSQGRSGWRIGGDGNAEFNNVTVRGTVESSRIRNSLFATDGFRYDCGGGRHAPFMIFWSEFFSDHSRDIEYHSAQLVSDVYLSPSYGSGYNRLRFSTFQQPVNFYATMSGDKGSFGNGQRLELMYRVENNGSWSNWTRIAHAEGDVNFRGGREIGGTWTPPSSWGRLQFLLRSIRFGGGDSIVESLSGFIQVFNFQ